LAKAMVHYAPRPNHWDDFPRWLADSKRSALEAGSPWWPYQAVAALDRHLPHDAKVFEFGGGGSTIWLCDRDSIVTCVEHDLSWFEQLKSAVGGRADLRLVEPDATGSIKGSTYPGQAFDSYVSSVSGEADESFDLVIVDGRARVACVLAAKNKVRRGGMLLLDDSNREKYAAVGQELRHWPMEVYRGLRPGGGGVSQTSMWTRP
jgi:Methyltransferase domain